MWVHVITSDEGMLKITVIYFKVNRPIQGSTQTGPTLLTATTPVSTFIHTWGNGGWSNSDWILLFTQFNTGNLEENHAIFSIHVHLYISAYCRRLMNFFFFFSIILMTQDNSNHRVKS